MSDKPNTWTRIERAQKFLNVAWFAGGAGWLIAFFGLLFGWYFSNGIEIILILCFAVAVCAIVGSLIAYDSDVP